MSQEPSSAEPITLSIVGCARCHGDGHYDLIFAPFTFPVELDGGEPLTHWALCPVTGEPILLLFVSDTADEAIFGEEA